MIEILSSGSLNSVQDLGRPGLLDQGIGRGGAMDRQALAIANRLVGNDPSAAGLEIGVMPFRLAFLVDCRFALAGAATDATLDGRSIAIFTSVPAKAGSVLRIAPPRLGARIVIAVSGGIDCPVVLGARATDLKSGFGGHGGRALVRGDRLSLLAADHGRFRTGETFGIDPSALRPVAGGTPGGAALEVRLMAGAEWSLFSEAARLALTQADWRVSGATNRQGMALSGPTLALVEPVELFSHGLMPGTVQVPPSGQPIIQLAEANTCGGYPKIGHVIEPDLWRLAQAPPDSLLRFRVISRDEAIAAIRADRTATDSIARTLRSMITAARNDA